MGAQVKPGRLDRATSDAVLAESSRLMGLGVPARASLIQAIDTEIARRNAEILRLTWVATALVIERAKGAT